MPIFTVSGDPHITHASLDKAEVLFDIFEDIGNDVIILGDLFDTKEIVRGKCMNFVLRRIRKSKLHFYIMVGNHDWFNLDCLDHSLEPLKDLKNVTIVDKPFSFNMDSRTALLLPYYDDLDQLKAILKDAKEGGTDYVFMHQGLIGFDYGNGHMADGSGHGEIDGGILKGFSRVVLGHFHKFAELENSMFLGTPFSHSHGETDQVKYIGVFDSDANTMELLETPFARHRTVEIDCSKKNVKSTLKKLLNGKDIFRIKLIGTEMEIKAIDQTEFQGVKFLEEATDGEQVESASLNETDSNETKFLSWAKDIKGLDDETIKLGLEILKGAS